MKRAACVLGAITMVWTHDLCFANQVFAGPGDGQVEFDPPVPQPKPEVQPEPPNGRRLYGAGIFGVAFGIFNIGYGIPLSITGPGDAYFSGSIPIAFGAAFIALGAAGIHYGKRRRNHWQAWQADPTVSVPVRVRHRSPPHVPWLIVGGLTTPLGIATVGMMVPILADPVLNTPRFAYGVTAWGAASVAAGIGMLTVGAMKARRPGRSDVALVPTSWVTRDGFGVGVAGRF